MIDALSIASSALTAQSTDLAVIANNVANARTPDYTAKQAVFVSMNPGVAVGAIVDTGQSVDIANELVDAMLARTAYQAAAKIFTTANRMIGTLLAI